MAKAPLLDQYVEIGGKIEETIIHGFTSKAHRGFFGHSYLGEWINIGALCTNSDLKNDYSTVQVYVKGEFKDSETTKVGSFMGDHTKLGIGCLLNTGTVISIGSNIVTAGKVLPKFIPSFTWYLNGKFYKGYGLKQIIETAKVVMSRRKVTMSSAEVKPNFPKYWDRNPAILYYPRSFTLLCVLCSL